MTQQMIPGINPLTGLAQTQDSTPTQAPDSGGFDWGGMSSDFLKNILNLNPGTSTGNVATGMAIPAFLAAYKQWQDSGKYSDTAQQASSMANPYGQSGDPRYADYLKYRQSWDDPNAFLKDPGHMAQLQSGMDTVTAQNAMKGYLGSGKMGLDLTAYAANENAKWLDQERQRLFHGAGGDFDPAKAASMLMQGNDQSIASENNAISTMMMPFLAQLSQNHLNNPNGQNTTTSTTKGITDSLKNITNPQDLIRQVQQLASMTGGSAASLLQQLLADPDINPSTAAIIRDITGGSGDLGDLTQDGSGGVGTIPPLNPFDPNPMGPSEPGLPGFITDPWIGGGDGGMWDSIPEVSYPEFSSFLDGLIP